MSRENDKFIPKPNKNAQFLPPPDPAREAMRKGKFDRMKELSQSPSVAQFTMAVIHHDGRYESVIWSSDSLMATFGCELQYRVGKNLT